MQHHLDISYYCSHRKNHSQCPLWEYPVPQSYDPPSSLLVNVNFDQRTVQPNYNHCHLTAGHPVQDVSSFGPWDVDPFEDLNHNVYNDNSGEAFTGATYQMEGDLFLPEDAFPGEEQIGPNGNMTFSFAKSFFANPFAVSFPGDISCPRADELPLGDSLSTSQSKTCSFRMAESIQQTATPQSIASTSSTSNSGISKCKSKVSTGTSYGPQIHFVDMTDKKGAQRIRNTMNSRKYRQNKLDKIRELEKKLAELEAEKDKWQGRAPT